MAAQSNKLHVAMFPWLAFGHIIPFLELSKTIAQKGHRISFLSTPRNIQRLPKIPPNLKQLIVLVELPLPKEDNLPENAESTLDVDDHIVPYLKKAHDGLQQPLSQFLTKTTPDWIICDFSPHWLPPIASRLGISCSYFSIFTPWCQTSLVPPISHRDERDKPEDFTVPPNWVPFDFPYKAVFRLYEAKKVFDHYEKNDSGISDISRLRSVLGRAHVYAIRSCKEIGGTYLNLLQRFHEIPVIPVGLLPPSSQDDSAENVGNSEQDAIIEWLDRQEQGSVIYVALGSEAMPSKEDYRELALGLELSGLPFFWVLRNRSSGKVELPDGFEERTGGRGLVWTGWVSQQKILEQPCIGGFLTHCGYSSIIEGLSLGHPLIMLPFFNETGLNARVFGDKKAGIEIPRNEEDGRFTRDDVAKTIRLVMKEEEGKTYRDGAKEMSKKVGDKDLHRKYIDQFVDFLETHRHKSQA